MTKGKRLGWYHGWNVVAGSILASIALMSLAINSLSLFLADWSRELGAPISTLQLAITGFGIACAVVSPFAGTLVDRWPGRPIFAFGFALLVLAELGVSFMSQTWQLLAVYIVVFPVAFMLLSLAGTACVMRWFVRRRGLAIALTSAGLGLSGMIVPPLVAAVMPDMGWRGVWRAGAIAIALVVAPLVTFIMRASPDGRDDAHYITPEDAPALNDAPILEPSFRWLDILVRSEFWLIVLTGLTMLSLYGAVTQNLAPIAVQKGLAIQAAGGLLSVLFATQLLFTLLGGVLSDRFGNRWPFAGFALATAAGAVIVSQAHGLGAMGVGVALAGIGCAFYPLLASAIAGAFGAGGFGRAYGLASGILCLAGLAPFAIARSQELTGAYDAALLTLAGLVLAAAALCALLLREPGRAAR